jgi:hypothetical protein
MAPAGKFGDDGLKRISAERVSPLAGGFVY